jgi:hypothetical protein
MKYLGASLGLRMISVSVLNHPHPLPRRNVGVSTALLSLVRHAFLISMNETRCTLLRIRIV